MYLCRKINECPYNSPKQPDLPAVCLNDHASFSEIGVDYSGALYCKHVFHSNSIDKDDMFKCYIVIYTCTSTSGVILEAVPDESTDTFFNSLSKLISRIGCPQIILSDDGGPFGADTTQQFVSNKNIQRKFALAKAPWYEEFG